MKIFDFARQDLLEMPMIEENSSFEYILDNNLISQIVDIPIACYKLSIANNKISFINSKISDGTQLRILDLSYNRIISLLGFNKLSNLEELNISNNYISDDQLNYLSNLHNLTVLNISNNNLKNDTFVHLLSSLKYIDKINLSNNNIENVNFCEKCETLTQIEIEANKIITFHIMNEKILPNLKLLSLNGNKLENIDSLNNLSSIECLFLNENEIRFCNLSKLKKLKFLYMKSNLLSTFTINENLTQIEFLEFSYNNLSSFTIEESHPNLKYLLLDNNKLLNLDITNKALSYKNVEMIDLSYNLLMKANFLLKFPNLQRLNLSFNQISNLKEIIQILQNFPLLKELSLVENEFNRNYYNIEVIPVEIFNCIDDYFKHQYVKGANKQNIIPYRNCVIINLSSLAYLDMIGINEDEKYQAMKANEAKVFYSSNYNINKSSRNITKNIHSNNIVTNSKNNFNKSFTNKEKDEQIRITNSNINNKSNLNINSVSVSNNKDNANNKETREIYDMFKQLMINICDTSGFITFKDFNYLCRELSAIYDIEEYISSLVTELKNLLKSSLLPNKFHIKDLTKILKQSTYDRMYLQIKSKLALNPNLSKSIHFSHNSIQLSTNKQKVNKEINNSIIPPLKELNNINEDKGITHNCNYDILNTFIMKSPMLVYERNNEDIHCKEKQIQSSPHKSNTLQTSKCFNFLYQSSSELINTSDLNSKLFMKNFLYFINHVPFPMKYSEMNQSFIISISSNEKEYKFLNSFMLNYKIQNFILEKWYCYEYYNQIFHNYSDVDYLFENSFMFFYSYYNEIVDNFFNDIYHLNECYLLIEESPLSLISSKEKENKIVMYILVQRTLKDSNNTLIENIVYNQKDDKFYFKNPFDWIGMSTSKKRNTNTNMNILVPVYIITF